MAPTDVARIVSDIRAVIAEGMGGDSLREIRKVDPRTNRATTEFVGQPSAWMSAFSPVRRRVTLFNKDN